MTDLETRLAKARQDIADATRATNEVSLEITVAKSVNVAGVITDYGTMKLEGWQDVPVVLKNDGNGDTLWLQRGIHDKPVFQVCFGYGEDTSKAIKDALQETPELGAVGAAMALSKEDARGMLGLGESPEHARKALFNFIGLYNAARKASAYKPQVMTEKTRTVKALPKVGPDEFGDLRLVTGIVLEPDIVDSQDDTYTAEEVRKTAHLYMLDYQNVGLSHEAIIDSAAVVESYVVAENAAGGIEIGGEFVKSGSWVMTVKVFDDEIWNDIKTGKINGFSIGGFAKRIPLADGPEPHNPNSF